MTKAKAKTKTAPVWSFSKAGNSSKARLTLEGREIPLTRVWAGLTWPGDLGGCYLVAGQAPGGHVYLLREKFDPDWSVLVRALAADLEYFGLELILQNGGRAGQAFQYRAHCLVEDEGLTGAEPWGSHKALPFSDAPHADLPSFGAELARLWIKQNKLSLVPECSLILDQIKRVAALSMEQVLSELPHLPVFRALIHLVSGLDSFPSDNPDDSRSLQLEPSDERTGI